MRKVVAGVVAAGLLLVGLGAWWWSTHMVEVVRAEWHVSDAARDNPLLAAQRLLARHGHALTLTRVLDQRTLATLPAGTLLLLPSAGQPDGATAARLLDWVRRGNTLIMTPDFRAPRRPDGRTAPVPADPLGARYGIRLGGRAGEDDGCRLDPIEAARRARVAARRAAAKRAASAPAGAVTPPAPAPDDEDDDDDDDGDGDGADDAGAPHAPPPPRHLVCVNLPGVEHELELERPDSVLNSIGPAPGATVQVSGTRSRVEVTEPASGAPAGVPGAPAPAWGDTRRLAVVVYGEGRGRVVMLAEDYFNNDQLRAYDHGELLLGLAAQAGAGTPVLAVRHVAGTGWLAYLWQHFGGPLAGAAVLLALWLWQQTRRFGPLVPAPTERRRALLEHIDASGRWLWRVPGGRDLLLDAARAGVAALLARRAPRLAGLDPAARCAALAEACGLSAAAVDRALYAPAAPRPFDFTTQLSTLQQLRAHYER